jgi:uncharacterized protein YdhG (YjbR/CyaY superfamily)
VRRTIRTAAPTATEGISYGIPTFKLGGQYLTYFGAAKHHLALYGALGSAIKANAAVLEPYVRSKGTIRFTPERPLPASLVTKLVKARMAQIKARAKR